MKFKTVLKLAAELKVYARQRTSKTGCPYLVVTGDRVDVSFVPARGGKEMHVYVTSRNLEDKSLPFHENTYLGKHPRHVMRKLIRIYSSCSPRYMSYALRHAGIMEHEECIFCEDKHAPSALHGFRHMSAKGV